MNARARSGAGGAHGRDVAWPVVLRSGDARARIRPWWNDQTVAQLTFVDHGIVPAAPIVRVWLDEIRARGFTAVRTGAVTEVGADALHRMGFSTLQTLHLLDLSLIGWRPPRLPDGIPLRSHRLWMRDRPAAAATDLAAFTATWAIDLSGIDETCRATPSHRARAIDHDAVVDSDAAADGRAHTLAGYAITGRADHHGYLQRLAVDPSAQGHGVGLSLTIDSLAWMQHRRLTRAVVNTHTDNEVALGLYQRVGFRILPHGLSVLVRHLDDR